MPINPANAIRVLVTQQARREVKDGLKSVGIRVNTIPAREINALADEHLRANAHRLIAETRNHPLILRYREEWQRYHERRSRRVCKS